MARSEIAFLVHPAERSGVPPTPGSSAFTSPAQNGPRLRVRVTLRLTGTQHARLKDHLFPGDGKESVALALCGLNEWRHAAVARRIVCVHEIHPIPDDQCLKRQADRVRWSTDAIPRLLETAQGRGHVLLKIHSHPTGYAAFSGFDDIADRELFTGVGSWLDSEFPGISAVMLPDGRIFARAISDEGVFSPVSRVAVAGHDLMIWDHDELSEDGELEDLDRRTAQVFGKRTTELLSRLSVGVVGTSGTGSAVVEQLYRLGVGELVLVDPDVAEEKNVRRIYNSTMADAAAARSKVDILADAIQRSGLATLVIRIPQDLFNKDVVSRLAQCDIVVGCMDSVDGRDLLNRMAVFYTIPYFDLGVRIDADGRGGVEQVCGNVHYVRPDGSTLMERGVYTAEELQAAALRRDHPEMYEEQKKEKYVIGMAEDRPAVISVNTLAAAIAANDLLARLHPFRDDPNSEVAVTRFSLTQGRVFTEPDTVEAGMLMRFVGRGDARPLLNVPALS